MDFNIAFDSSPESKSTTKSFSGIDFASAKRVKNVFPSTSSPDYKLAIIGEAPGETEEKEGLPFVGASGSFLTNLMEKAHIKRSDCFVGNVCQIRPPGNKIEKFSWNGPEIQEGIERLREDLNQFQPNACVLLGNIPLRAFTNKHGKNNGISFWRGSILRSDYSESPFHGVKCIPAYHPSYLLRSYGEHILLAWDLLKARKQARFPDLRLPERLIEHKLSFDELMVRLDRLNSLPFGTKVSLDIEGYVDNMTCISFAWDPLYAFVVPFVNGIGDSYWTFDQELAILHEIKKFLHNPRIFKVLQNSLYDRFVMAYSYRMLASNVVDDTMVGHWELLCELEKSLALQTSIYTDEPYYKFEGKSDSFNTRLLYNGKDSCVTQECNITIQRQLDKVPESKRHYLFNMDALNPFLYMELRGIRYNRPKALEERGNLLKQSYELQYDIDCVSERAGLVSDPMSLISPMCFKRSSYNIHTAPQHAKKNKPVARVVELYTRIPFANNPKEIVGEILTLTEAGLNVDSPPQMTNFLYNVRKYPPIYNKESHTLTANKDAILSIYSKKSQDPFLLNILRLRAKKDRAGVLAARTDSDGRIRSTYSNVGTETGRCSNSESPTGSGFNLQTVTKELRYLFEADEGCYMFQCDLAGADGWTVAAHCAKFGDRTMLDDYLYGLKPAKIIALMYEKGPEINRLSRQEIKERCKDVDPDGWLYFAGKRIQHSSNYLAKEHMISDIILRDSYKLLGDPIWIEPSISKKLQMYYFLRYWGVKKWHNEAQTKLVKTGKLTSASGHTRKFYNRRYEHSTLGQYVSHEPQSNTTYVTNTSVERLWNDKENRRSNGSLRVEPLHQIHDALLGQFQKSDLQFALRKIPEWFNITITIAGIPIQIPFEGNYGKSWGELKDGVIKPLEG